ncbi:MAG: ubiE 1, partial [Gammaproteobacteria bacterium]|nr:ubiE 1 [Gammaproteobacteria bacterium]
MYHNRMQFLKLLVFPLLWSSAVYVQQAAARDVNAEYKAPDLDIQVWVDRFEGEGREVFDYRNDIIAAIGLQPGQQVADVGAGTGLFVPLLADKVGVGGKVYAVDITPKFIEHIQKKIQERGLTQVETVLNDEHSAGLPEHSVDVVFTSDVYHHFAYIEDMLASIRSALRPGGQFIVVDYDKIPGKSSEFILQHVRDTK